LPGIFFRFQIMKLRYSFRNYLRAFVIFLFWNLFVLIMSLPMKYKDIIRKETNYPRLYAGLLLSLPVSLLFVSYRRMRVEGNRIIFKKSLFFQQNSYSLQDVKDFRWFTSAGTVMVKHSTFSTQNSVARITFKDGTQFDFDGFVFSNFEEMRKYLYTYLREEKIVDYSWIDEIRARESEKAGRKRR
jgi:hypothetical protein